jgi:hypothetical protein
VRTRAEDEIRLIAIAENVAAPRSQTLRRRSRRRLVDAIAADKIAGSQIPGDPAWANRTGAAPRRRQRVRRLPQPGAPDDSVARRLGKKTETLLATAEQLRKQVRYAYGPPLIRFTDADVDRTCAGGGC